MRFYFPAIRFLLCALAFGSEARAQQADAPSEEFKAKSEFGAAGGAFLPSRIAGASEVMTIWALRGAYRTSKGLFEAEAMNGRSKGVTYSSLSIDYRYDLGDKDLPAFFLIGGHADYYFPSDGAAAKFSGGWHYGGGAMLKIAGPVWFRADFKHRFGPGTSLTAMAGLSFRFADGGAD